MDEAVAPNLASGTSMAFDVLTSALLLFKWLTSGVVEGVGVDKEDSLCIELDKVAWRLMRNCNNSVTGWGAGGSIKLADGCELKAGIGNFARVFRFLQQRMPHLLHRHWDNSLHQHMAVIKEHYNENGIYTTSLYKYKEDTWCTIYVTQCGKVQKFSTIKRLRFYV